MAAGLLGVEDVDRLLLADPAGTLGVVLDDKAGEGLADDEAHVEGQAGVLAGAAAGAFEGDYVIGVMAEENGIGLSKSAWCFLFVFFQSEDGIRALVRSRGLGDVYKRQALPGARGPVPVHAQGADSASLGGRGWSFLGAVSYTHLTLPTIYSV